MVTNYLLVNTTLVVGALAGALLAEGALIVPYWQGLSEEDFFRLHKNSGFRLFQFYGPLTIAAAFMTVLNSLSSSLCSHPGECFSLSAMIMLGLAIVMYFAYFRKANAGFATGVIVSATLQEELAKWAFLHWIRVGFVFVAFIFLLMALAFGV